MDPFHLTYIKASWSLVESTINAHQSLTSRRACIHHLLAYPYTSPKEKIKRREITQNCFKKGCGMRKQKQMEFCVCVDARR